MDKSKLSYKKLSVIILIVGLVALISGCSELYDATTGKPIAINSESTGVWNQYFVYPLSWMITKVANLLSSTSWNYGLALIIVTILIRLALLPLMVKQMKSTKAMQVIQPEIQELKEKYSSKDQKTQQKLQQETMLLFQKHNVNPMAGCLPLFIQMPILIAFYHAIIRTSEIASHQFLYFDLGQRDPYFILPIVAAIATFIQQKLMMKGQEGNQQLRLMLYIMPVMILVFAINLPAALSLYWVVGNIFSILQTLLIKIPSVENPAAKAGGAIK